jgi:hypothetical protein
MKGLYKLEVIKNDKASGLKKGKIVDCFGTHWIVDFHLRTKEELEKDDYTDLLFFLIWIPDKGWFWVEKCHFKPLGAKLNIPGIC